jgi:cbb3-type cytochrome oxidase cytochrome c subunit
MALAGSTGLLILSVLLAFLIPAIPQPADGVRTSNHAFSTPALAGREVYTQQGCGTCHTQLIRNVVTDVRLGPVTLDDTNQIIGYRRIGPDLAAIGSRIQDTQAISALLAGGATHPPATGLSDEDIANLIAYLRESR